MLHLVAQMVKNYSSSVKKSMNFLKVLKNEYIDAPWSSISKLQYSITPQHHLISKVLRDSFSVTFEIIQISAYSLSYASLSFLKTHALALREVERTTLTRSGSPTETWLCVQNMRNQPLLPPGWGWALVADVNLCGGCIAPILFRACLPW